MTHEAKDGLFTTTQGTGSVTREEAAYMISDLVSALSEAKPKDGTKASVTLRQDALREGRTMLKRLLQSGWHETETAPYWDHIRIVPRAERDAAEPTQEPQDAARTHEMKQTANKPTDEPDAADAATDDAGLPWSGDDVFATADDQDTNG